MACLLAKRPKSLLSLVAKSISRSRSSSFFVANKCAPLFRSARFFSTESSAASSTLTPPPIPTPPASKPRKPKSALKILTKSGLSLFNAFGAVGMSLALLPYDPLTAAAVGLGTYLVAGASQAMNQIKEVQYDAMMSRTKDRPLVTGAMTLQRAKLLSLIYGTTGLLTLSTVSLYASATAALTLLGYVYLYTPWKRWNRFNTHLGAVVGSLPPIIGYLSAVGPVYHPIAPLVFGFLYSWQFPHFYGLAWWKREDYLKAGFKMVSHPDIDPTGKITARGMTQGVMGMSLFVLLVSLYFQHTSHLFLVGLVPILCSVRSIFRFSRATTDAERILFGRKIFLWSLACFSQVIGLWVVCAEDNESTEKRSTFLRTMIQKYFPGPLQSLENRWTFCMKKISNWRQVFSNFCPHPFKTKPQFCPVVHKQRLEEQKTIETQ
eukprot:TRINITY_DN995_c0_g1_i1.p1 TRINITY_DN995_c0_g1~~TRINITY_DN995_c0_g1_i1.p1  ORF type:complete len:451 (+),score=68.92 TRINITY_DN995_c0_g1_i1:53-1354(+)